MLRTLKYTVFCDLLAHACQDFNGSIIGEVLRDLGSRALKSRSQRNKSFVSSSCISKPSSTTLGLSLPFFGSKSAWVILKLKSCHSKLI
jgi:hypothetical protein